MSLRPLDIDLPLKARGAQGMKFKSINQAFTLVGVILMILFGVGTGTGIWAVIKLSAEMQDMAVSSQIIRTHMLADMNHDAIRGDVLLALESQVPGSIIKLDQVRQDSADHAKEFRESVQENLARASDPKIHDALVKVQAPLLDYLADSENLLADVSTDPQKVRNELKGFMDKFHTLETAMADTTNTIQLSMDEESKRIEAMTKVIKVLTTLALVLGLGMCFLLIMVAKAQLVKPLVDVTGAVDQLAKGNYEIDVPTSTRSDELGLLTRSLAVFKQVIADRASEVEAAEQRALLEREREENERRRLESEREQLQMVEAIGRGLERLSNGDLSAQLNESFAPEFETLRKDFNTTIQNLRTTIQAVMSTANGMNSGIEEISRASDDLSHRTENQAASLEETAAALDEVTAKVASSSDGARKVASAMSETRNDASSSVEVVQNAVNAMGEIEHSSRQISKIVGVIDEIAFQTNLLALNAGVEAARAGEAGRGFAVVASEVRSLAQRCGEAAKEIKGLISASSGQVESGVKLVAAAGDALGRIVGNITEIDTLIAEIATSSSEQATGLSEVNTAVNQMDQVTQQNAAMVQEMSTGASTLKWETSELNRQMSHFKLDNNASGGTRPQMADPGVHKPGNNPVAQAQAKLAKLSASLGTATAEGSRNWEGF